MDFPQLTSAQNSQIKTAVKLGSSRIFRQETERIIFEGLNLLQEIPPNLIETIFFNQEILPNISQAVLKKINHQKVFTLPPALIRKISTTKGKPPVIVIAQKPTSSVDLSQAKRVVFLENLQDPGNLGTILRSSLASDVDAVVLDEKSVDLWSPKALRAGMGAHFHLQAQVTNNLLQSIKDFPGTCYATTLSGENLFKTKLAPQSAFVLGNEGQGLSNEAALTCQKNVTIPMSDKSESLNVGIAATMCAYEHFRQFS